MSKTKRNHEAGEALDRLVEKQTRLALRSTPERRKRRLALRRMNGQRPRVTGVQPCIQGHENCRTLIFSDQSTRCIPALAVVKVGGR